jgi:outer membrane protein OmpA-like peptidoglycan-associated protein
LNILKLFRLLLIGVLIIISSSKIVTADDLYARFQYGLFGNMIIVNQNSDFKNIPGYFSCSPKFDGGSGKGVEFGALAEYPLLTYFLVGSRLGFESFSSKLETDQSFQYQNGDKISIGVITHSIESKFSNLFADFYLGIRPLPGLITSFGLRAEYSLTATFSQKETLKFPNDFGTFENGKRERNMIFNQDLPSVPKPFFDLKASISYEFILNKKGTIRFAPEISYLVPLNPVVKNMDWYSYSARVGASVKFSKPEVKPLNVDISTTDILEIRRFNSCNTNVLKFQPEELVFTPTVEAPAGVTNWEFKLFRGGEVITSQKGKGNLPDKMILQLQKDSALFANLNGEYTYSLYVQDEQEKEVNIEKTFVVGENHFNLQTDLIAYGVDIQNNKKYTKKTIQLLRKITTNVRPLLSYIFYETGSGEIPKRYNSMNRNSTFSFDLKEMHKLNAIEIYHDLLNILGFRMREYPDTKIDLVGCLSDLPEENGNFELASSRANNIKQYLMNIWDIDSSRINFKYNELNNGLPNKPSTPGYENHIKESAEENQRVEIQTSPENAFLLDPVITTDTLNQVFPLQFVFLPKIQIDKQKYHWQLNIAQNGKQFAKYEGENNIPDAIEMSLKDREAEMIDKGGNLYYDFTVVDEFGQKCNKDGQIEVELLKLDSSFYKYSLILFEYESYKIESKNKQIIDLVRNSLSEGANLSITGFSDKLGDSLTNRILSKNRALFATKKILGFDGLYPDEDKPINAYDSLLLIDNRIFEDFQNADKLFKVKYSVSGYGEQEPLLYDNSTPEGRFYSRTVTVSVVNEKNITE